MIENIYIGKGSISNLSEILKSHSAKKVFLVTGKSSYEKSGAQEIMESLLCILMEKTVSHALSYKMTSLFDVPHGHAVALTLVHVMKVNYEYAKEDIQMNIKALFSMSNSP